MQYLNTPFFNNRETDINILMFHCSALTLSEMVATLAQNELSCHYIIDEKGQIVQLVEETKRAWHGGVGYWRGIDKDINSHSIGIELCHPTLGQTPYPDEQINSLINLSKQIITRHKIKPQYIIGHSDSAPTRKPDPGKNFPWQYLAQQGIGLWYDLRKKSPLTDIKELLSSIGYDTSSPQNTAASQFAFARHFIPHLIPYEEDIQHLVETIYPQELNLSNHPQFLPSLQAVCYSFND